MLELMELLESMAAHCVTILREDTNVQTIEVFMEDRDRCLKITVGRNQQEGKDELTSGSDADFWSKPPKD